MPASHQVIYTYGGGRFGNQILRFAHWIAWVLEHETEVEVRDFAFWPYAPFFDVWRRHPGCVFPLRSDGWDEVARWRTLLPEYVGRRVDWRAQQLLQRLGGLLPGWRSRALDDVREEVLDLGMGGLVDRDDPHRRTAVAGWRIQYWQAVARYDVTLRQLFRPAPDRAAYARLLVSELRSRHDFILGVQIRRTDYRTWHDGRFVFTDEVYRKWIEQFLGLHPDRTPVVVIVSDEPLSADVWEGLPVVVLRTGVWFDDWVALSLCDLVLGPPSTFSATAAWVGGISLWPVAAADQNLKREQIISGGIVGAAHDSVFGLAVR